MIGENKKGKEKKPSILIVTDLIKILDKLLPLLFTKCFVVLNGGWEL
jgi:hypothetical protein